MGLHYFDSTLIMHTPTACHKIAKWVAYLALSRSSQQIHPHYADFFCRQPKSDLFNLQIDLAS